MKQYRPLVIFGLMVTMLVSYNFISAQWIPASGTPPANNTPAPVNIGSITQAKNGNLAANIFAATTEMRSNRYCDALGGNCFTATSTSSSGTPTCVVRTGAGSASCLAGEVAMGGGCTSSCAGVSSGNCTDHSIISSTPTANGWSCTVSNRPITSVRCCTF
jgi:hypothetical protein